MGQESAACPEVNAEEMPLRLFAAFFRRKFVSKT